MPILIYSTDGVWTGDSFTGANGSLPDASHWDLNEEVASVCTIQNNKLNVTDNTASDNNDTRLSTLTPIFVGNKTIDIDWDVVAFGQPSSGQQRLLFGIRDVTATNYAASTINTVIGIYRNTINELLYTIDDSTSGYAQVATADTSGKFRVNRTGSVIKVWYYSGGQWQWNGNTGIFAVNAGVFLFLSFFKQRGLHTKQ